MKNNIRHEDAPVYGPIMSTLGKEPVTLSKELAEEETICAAMNILMKRIRRPMQTEPITCPTDMKNFFWIKLSRLEHEVFAVAFLDNRHRVITYEEMFRGTIDGASVYPREVVKAALKHNAAAIVCAHNHPSGVPEPSNADEAITIRLKNALELVQVSVLDHVIIGRDSADCVSLAERGVF